MVMELYIFNFAFRASQLPGIASAVAVILFLITLAFMLPLFRLRSASELEEMA
jgi:ABC-type sugar transport system permease subunit